LQAARQIPIKGDPAVWRCQEARDFRNAITPDAAGDTTLAFRRFGFGRTIGTAKLVRSIGQQLRSRKPE
jgi:hypothetical protein